MNPELQETRELVNVLTRFVENYERSAPRTDPLALKCAAARAREALTDCLSKATLELGSEDGGSRIEDSFDCKACGVSHELARDRAMLDDHRLLGAAAPYLILMREFRYEHRHAKEVVRQLELRRAGGNVQRPTSNVQHRIEEAEVAAR
jgi:hypothetical protein